MTIRLPKNYVRFKEQIVPTGCKEPVYVCFLGDGIEYFICTYNDYLDAREMREEYLQYQQQQQQRQQHDH